MKIAAQKLEKRNKLSKLYFTCNLNRPLTNDAIEDDAEDPKEASHLDYKYLKSFEGPLTKQPIKAAKNDDREALIKNKKPPKVLFSFERKKFGGIRMC